MTMDTFLLFNAVISFGVFVGLYALLFRRARSRDIIPWLLGFFIAGALVNIAGSFFFFQEACTRSAGSWGKLFFATITLFLYGLIVSFVAVMTFVPNETSMRLRLLSEIDATPSRAASWDLLSKNYSHEEILRRRLDRLLASREIFYREGRYYAARTVNFFSFRNFLLRKMNRYLQSGKGAEPRP